MTYPTPLTPSDCDLRDFAFMPLDVVRLRDSDLAALESPEACWAAVLLWAASWHQIPAASIPDDDRVLANLAGYGRVVKEWQRVREGSLRGWVKCSDGRLYHPVVAEKANEAWLGKEEYRARREAERLRKQEERERRKREAEGVASAGQGRCSPPDNVQVSVGQDRSVRRTRTKSPPDKMSVSVESPPEIALTGTVDRDSGQGKVNQIPAAATEPSSTSPPSEAPPPRVVEIVGMIRGLERSRGIKMPRISGSDGQVKGWVESGVDDAKLREAYGLAAADRTERNDPSPINAGFLDIFVTRLVSPQKVEAKSAVAAVPWFDSWSGIEAKAREHGIIRNKGETDPAFKARVFSAAGVTDETLRQSRG